MADPKEVVRQTMRLPPERRGFRVRGEENKPNTIVDMAKSGAELNLVGGNMPPHFKAILGQVQQSRIETMTLMSILLDRGIVSQQEIEKHRAVAIKSLEVATAELHKIMTERSSGRPGGGDGPMSCL